MRKKHIWFLAALLIFMSWHSAAQTRHLIVGYDTSGSMAEKYLGPGMHALVQQAVEATLLGQGFDVAAHPNTGRDVIWAEQSSQSGFCGFPLIKDGTLVSFFSFSEECRIVIQRRPLEVGAIPLFAREQNQGETNISKALEVAAWKLMDPARDTTVYWLLVSDGKHDPANPAKVPNLDLTQRNLSQMYTLTLHVAANHYEPIYNKWLAGDKQLVAAFGPEGPPEYVKLFLYKLWDTSWALPPALVSCMITEVRKEGMLAELRFKPGESSQGENGARENADHYLVEMSEDGKNWKPVGDKIPASHQEIYAMSCGPLGDGKYYFRVAALQADRQPQYSAEIPFQTSRVVVHDQPKVVNGRTTLTWDSPRQPDITMQVQKSADRGTSWRLIGSVPSSQGEFVTDAVKPGDWLRLDAVTSDGKVGSLSEPMEVGGTAAPSPPPAPSPIQSDGAAGGAVLGVGLLLALLAIGGTGIFMLIRYQMRSIAFSLEWPDRRGEDGLPLSRHVELRRRQRFELAEPVEVDNRLVGQWIDINAPRDYIVNRGDAVYHVRHSEPDETGAVFREVDTPLADGDELLVKSQGNEDISLLYRETAAEERAHGTVDLTTEAARDEGDVL